MTNGTARATKARARRLVRMNRRSLIASRFALGLAATLSVATWAAAPALAQDATEKPARLVMVGLGPRYAPAWIGDDDHKFGVMPQIEVWKEGQPFPAETPDEAKGFRLTGKEDRAQAGLVIGFAPSRSRKDVGLAVDRIGFGMEPGIYGQVPLGQALRLRGEVRHAVGSHNALRADLMLDHVVRLKDDAVVATVGPRVRFGDARFQRRMFGVDAAASARTGLTPYRPDAGLHAVGVAAGAQIKVKGPWGVALAAGYDRLTGPGATSPIVRAVGSRDQWSLGMALTHTFRIKRK